MLESNTILTIIFILINVLIFCSFYIFLSFIKLSSVSEKIISSALLVSAQVIFTELIFGNTGSLTSFNLLIANFFISASLISICILKNRSLFIQTARDIPIIRTTLNNSISIHTIFLSVLILLVSLWILLAAIMLPPRAIDDLTYHLPPIYEYIINHRIFLLPVEYRVHVAFPMNAELLILWPTILFKNLIPIGLVQYCYGLLGILVIYAIARQLSLGIKSSILSGQIFFFAPVVLIQAGTAYIDIIISVFFLISIYLSVRFYITERSVYLFLLGISIGLLLGMKYSMITGFLLLQVFITPRLIKKNKKDILVYLCLILSGSSYWYIRNYLAIGDPFYPILKFLTTYGFIHEGNFELSSIIIKSKEILNLLFTRDIGIGSLHGGYGIIFWGMAFPAWIYFTLKCFLASHRNKIPQLFIWAQMLFGLFLLYLVPLDLFHLVPRYSIFMVGIGCIAVGKLTEYYGNNKLYRTVIIILCCIFSFSSLFQMAKSKLPSYAVDIPIYDTLKGNDYSKMRYLRISSTSMAFLWETLDYITLNHPDGLNTYFASSVLDYAAPVYGSRIQNGVWNFGVNQHNPPDALLFLAENEEKMSYYGKKITLEEATLDSDLQIIDMAEKAYLFIQREILTNDKSIRQSLIKHYNNYYKREILTAKALAKDMEDNIPLVTSSYEGIGFLYLELVNGTDNPVHIVPSEKEEPFIKKNKLLKFYTINSYTEGFRHRLVSKGNTFGSKYSVYLNY